MPKFSLDKGLILISLTAEEAAKHGFRSQQFVYVSKRATTPSGDLEFMISSFDSVPGMGPQAGAWIPPVVTSPASRVSPVPSTSEQGVPLGSFPLDRPEVP